MAPLTERRLRPAHRRPEAEQLRERLVRLRAVLAQPQSPARRTRLLHLQMQVEARLDALAGDADAVELWSTTVLQLRNDSPAIEQRRRHYLTERQRLAVARRRSVLTP